MNPDPDCHFGGLGAAACGNTNTLAARNHLGIVAAWHSVAREPEAMVVSLGDGWDSSEGLEGPVPTPGSCHYRRSVGEVLPDPYCTPGAIDAGVNQGNLASTLCRPGGYTSSVRPPAGVTEPFKVVAIAAYEDTGPVGSFELDHLVPLELGGSSDTRNLWPEPDDHPMPGVANSKDLVESQMHELVCNAVTGGPSVSLSLAQRLIVSDWTTALTGAAANALAGAKR